jgi:hypothetical protein
MKQYTSTFINKQRFCGFYSCNFILPLSFQLRKFFLYFSFLHYFFAVFKTSAIREIIFTKSDKVHKKNKLFSRSIASYAHKIVKEWQSVSYILHLIQKCLINSLIYKVQNIQKFLLMPEETL